MAIGVTRMKKLIPAAALFLGVIAAGIVVWLEPWDLGSDARDRDLQIGEASDEAPTLAVNKKPAAVVEAPRTDPRFHRAGRAQGHVAGVVVDRGHRPVSGAEVKLSFATGPIPTGLEEPAVEAAACETRTDAEGRFAFSGLAVGAYRVEAAKEGLGEASRMAAADSDDGLLRLRLRHPQPGRTLIVHVVDAYGADIVGATVTATPRGRKPVMTATTDKRGRASFEVDEWYTVIVRAENASGVAQLSPNIPYSRLRRATVKLQLGKSGALEGQLHVPAGSEMPAEVQALMLSSGSLSWAATVATSTRADASGRYRFPALAPGPYAIRVKAGNLRVKREPTEGPAWREVYPFQVDRVTVEEGRTATHDLTLVVGGTLRGRARTTTGQPVVGALVEAHVLAGSRNGSGMFGMRGLALWRMDSAEPHQHGYTPFTYFSTRTDVDGRWQIEGLVPSDLYRVRVVPRGNLAFAYEGDVRVSDGRTTVFDHVLRPAGALEVVTVFNSYWGVREIGSETYSALWIQPNGSAPTARIPRLATGSYEIMGGVPWKNERVAVQAGTFEIREGETTYLDLRGKGESQLAIRVVRGAAPVVGARVTPFSMRTRLTDAEGRASWTVREAHKYRLYGQVQAPEPGGILLHFNFPEGATGVRRVELPSGVVNARFVDASGRGVEGAQFTLHKNPPRRGHRRFDNEPSPGAAGFRDAFAAADASGAIRWSSVPKGPYRIDVEDPRTGMRAQREIEVTDDKPINVVMNGYVPVTVNVRVVDEEGHAVKDAFITVTARPGADDFGDWKDVLLFRDLAVSDDEGRAVLRGIPIGAVRVGARTAEGHRPGQRRGFADLLTTLGSNSVEVVVKRPKKRKPLGLQFR